MEILRQLGPWFLIASVILMYALYAYDRLKNQTKIWPTGHPWSAITLLLLAFQELGRQQGLDQIWLDVVGTASGITAVLWIWSAFRVFRQSKDAHKNVE